MTQNSQVYSVYLSRHRVEIRDVDDSGDGDALLACGQAKYHNALNFALRLAQNKNLPLKNLTAGNLQPIAEVGDGFHR